MTTNELTVEAPLSSTGVLLAQLGRTARRWFRAALAPLELKPAHVSVLHQLRSGPIGQQALGDALDVDASNLVAILNDLEAKGLSTRHRDPDGRRLGRLPHERARGRAVPRLRFEVARAALPRQRNRLIVRGGGQTVACKPIADSSPASGFQ